MTPHDSSANEHDDPVDRADTDADTVDSEQVGRLLLSKQSPAEQSAARKIFQSLMRGEDPANLQEEIQNFARLRVGRIEQQHHNTQWR